MAKKAKSKEKIAVAVSLADRAAKKQVIHKNKAARLKSSLSKLSTKEKTSAKPKAPKTKKSAKK